MSITKKIADYENYVRDVLLKNQEGIEPADISACLLKAIANVYSKIKPLDVYWRIEDDDVDGATQSWDMDNDWENGFSFIKSVEYPAGEDPPIFLEKEEYDQYYDSDEAKWKFRMFEDTPGINEAVIVNHTARHTLDNDNNTIPDSDFYGVCDIAAEEICRMLALRHAQDSAPTISADSSNRSSISSNFLKMADAFKKSWQDFFGIKKDSGKKAAFVLHDQDRMSGIDQGDQLFHGRKIF